MLKNSPPQATYLRDYRPSDFLIDTTLLRVQLFEDKAHVISELEIQRNPAATRPTASLELNAEAMQVLSVRINGTLLREGRDYRYADDILAITEVGERFTLATQVEIHPESNTSLMGLYKSRTMLCTQCEAEGFRKITPYIDRPDVLSRFTTTVEADRDRYPTLLSNGNLVEACTLEGGRHRATWVDPFPKPAYLFALVAGDLRYIEDSFTTVSDRDICIRMYVEEKDLDKCDHALTSLKAAMRWDESTYGREYDLDIFMIVAVDDFNMGAMENKGLNIFNTSAVLANPATTTDMRFQWVEAVVAHEYFHNWSGNRVTCRDWFQLSLKEGFTVYRDSEFSADMNSRTVKRIEDVRMLKAHQFAEDAGPLAHPVQPDSYMEINNFYTMTVYEKGAEIVRMQANLLGPELFRQGTDLYFSRHDGSAVTIEDFVACMEEASGQDLTQFKRWYKHAGTPVVDVDDGYDAESGEYTLHFAQSCPPTPECDSKKPFVIPVKMGLIGESGSLDLHCAETGIRGGQEAVLQVNRSSQSFVFSGIHERPVPSLLRSFSAPVRLNFRYQRADLYRLISWDTDGFNRWDALQRLTTLEIEDQQTGLLNAATIPVSQDFIALINELTSDPDIDKAVLALMLVLPSMDYLADAQETIDLDSLWLARQAVKLALARELESDFARIYRAHHQSSEPYSPTARQIASRSLKNTALNYWLLSGSDEALESCRRQCAQADNMTDQAAALTALVNTDSESALAATQDALKQFYEQWQHENLVVNQWLAIQASSERPGGLQRVQKLMDHPVFDHTNPNKVRSLIGGFCGLNPHNLHNADGSGYAFVADQVIHLNAINPQIASRLVNPLSKWRRMDESRAGMMRAQLERISHLGDLSTDLREVVGKSL